MKKTLATLAFFLATAVVSWAVSTTTNLSLNKPASGESGWDAYLNSNADILDGLFDGVPFSVAGDMVTIGSGSDAIKLKITGTLSSGSQLANSQIQIASDVTGVGGGFIGSRDDSSINISGGIERTSSGTWTLRTTDQTTLISQTFGVIKFYAGMVGSLDSTLDVTPYRVAIVTENGFTVGAAEPSTPQKFNLNVEQDADTVALVNNEDAGTTATARLVVSNNGGLSGGSVLVGGTGYTTVAQWQDAMVINAGSALSGGLHIRTSVGDINFHSVGASTSAPEMILDSGGELNLAAIASDGTGKVICVKSDGNVGTCSDQPNGSGVCTCG